MKDVRPIKTKKDYEWALAEVSRYFDNQPEVGTPDGDRFEVLLTLVEAYEDEHWPMPVLDPVDTLKAHMEMEDKNQAALAGVIGSRPRASEIMNRKRALTVDMIYKINKEWRIPAELLIQPYHLDVANDDQDPERARRA